MGEHLLYIYSFRSEFLVQNFKLYFVQSWMFDCIQFQIEKFTYFNYVVTNRFGFKIKLRSLFFKDFFTQNQSEQIILVNFLSKILNKSDRTSIQILGEAWNELQKCTHTHTLSLTLSLYHKFQSFEISFLCIKNVFKILIDECFRSIKQESDIVYIQYEIWYFEIVSFDFPQFRFFVHWLGRTKLKLIKSPEDKWNFRIETTPFRVIPCCFFVLGFQLPCSENHNYFFTHTKKLFLSKREKTWNMSRDMYKIYQWPWKQTVNKCQMNRCQYEQITCNRFISLKYSYKF